MSGERFWMRKTRLVAAPFQPAMKDAGFIGSLNVYVTVSAGSARPGVPPVLFTAWISVPVGATVSLVTVAVVSDDVSPVAARALARSQRASPDRRPESRCRTGRR